MRFISTALQAFLIDLCDMRRWVAVHCYDISWQDRETRGIDPSLGDNDLGCTGVGGEIEWHMMKLKSMRWAWISMYSFVIVLQFYCYYAFLLLIPDRVLFHHDHTGHTRGLNDVSLNNNGGSWEGVKNKGSIWVEGDRTSSPLLPLRKRYPIFTHCFITVCKTNVSLNTSG